AGRPPRARAEGRVLFEPARYGLALPRLACLPVDDRFVLVEPVIPEIALRLRTEHVAVLGAKAAAAGKHPVVEERGVLAAVDRPEEGVTDRRSGRERRAICRHQESGRASVLLER